MGSAAANAVKEAVEGVASNASVQKNSLFKRAFSLLKEEGSPAEDYLKKSTKDILNGLAKDTTHNIDDATKEAFSKLANGIDESGPSFGQKVKDWYGNPIKRLRNDKDPKVRERAAAEIAARYGVTAAGATAGIGVIHDMASSDENDLGLTNVPISAGIGAGVGTAAYGISKLLKV